MFRYASSGDIYEGHYKAGKKVRPATKKPALLHRQQRHPQRAHTCVQEGRGMYRYGSTGELFEGQYKDGQRDGRGRFCYADGDQYVGEWRAGQKVRAFDRRQMLP